MTVSTRNLHCDSTKDILLKILQEAVKCDRIGNTLVLDTPYGFGDGHLLRVHLVETPDGIIVSDGGFAARQIEMHSPVATSAQSYRSLRVLAEAHALRWDGQLSFMEPTLEDALYNLYRLTAALHEAEVALNRPRRLNMDTSAVLKRGLETQYNIKMRADYPITLPEMSDPVVVDLLAEYGRARAVIEVIEAHTERAVQDQVYRSLANFMTLNKGGYEGIRIGVFNSEVLNIDQRAIERFRYAKPDNVLLMDHREALERVGPLLHAAQHPQPGHPFDRPSSAL